LRKNREWWGGVSEGFFSKTLRQIYDQVRDRVREYFTSLRERISVEPKYIDVPEEYMDAINRDLSGIDQASAIKLLGEKIKAGIIISNVVEANRSLNKLYRDLKVVEREINGIIESMEKDVDELINKYYEKDLETNNNAWKILGNWKDTDNDRLWFRNIVLKIRDSLVSDLSTELKNIEVVTNRVSSIVDEFENVVEAIKTDTREHRKLLYRFVVYGKDIRTKGSRLYLPVAKITIKTPGRKIELLRIHSGNLHVTDKMMSYINNSLKDIDKDFVSAIRKYISANYGGLRKLFLLRIFKTHK
jgi:hypothetical protein